MEYLEQKEERRISYLKAIATRKTPRITFCADSECKAEILEEIKDVPHKIIEVDNWFLTIEFQ